MGRQVFYMVGFLKGFVSGVSSVAGSISRTSTTGSNWGKYIGSDLAGSRMRYLLDNDAFKVNGLAKTRIDDAVLNVGDNPKVLDDLTEGTIEREEAVLKLSRQFDDASIGRTSKMNKKLAESLVSATAHHSNKSKIYIRLGGAAGKGTVLATAGILIYGVASTISAMLGGAFDKLLDAAAESETGTYAMMGVVVVGSILAIDFVRGTIS